MLRTINNIFTCLCARRNFCRAQFNIFSFFVVSSLFLFITCLMTAKVCRAQSNTRFLAWSIFVAERERKNEFIFFSSFYLIISVLSLFDCFSASSVVTKEHFIFISRVFIIVDGLLGEFVCLSTLLRIADFSWKQGVY